MPAALALGNAEMIYRIDDIGFDTFVHRVKWAHMNIGHSCELVVYVVVVVVALVLVTVLCIQRLVFRDIVAAAFVNESRTSVDQEFEEQLRDRLCVGPVGMISVDNSGCSVEHFVVVNRFRIHCLSV